MRLKKNHLTTRRKTTFVRPFLLLSSVCFFRCLDLQMKPYRTDEFVHRLFYETCRFSAFNNQWVVKARINNSQKDPTQSSERDMTYQVSCL